MKRISNVKVLVDANAKDILEKVAKKANVKPNKIKYFKIIKKSLDARNKSDIFYNVTADISETAINVCEKEYVKVSNKAKILVVGAGPAGLFCALELLRHGLNDL